MMTRRPFGAPLARTLLLAAGLALPLATFAQEPTADDAAGGAGADPAMPADAGAAAAPGTDAAAAEASPDAAGGSATAAAPAEPAPAGNEAPPANDFPTVAIADYVLGCMAANGNSYEALQQCSCSIDFIMARMEYKAYEQASTVMQVQRDIGQRGIFYRDSSWARNRVKQLEDIQAESTLRCF